MCTEVHVVVCVYLASALQAVGAAYIEEDLLQRGLWDGIVQDYVPDALISLYHLEKWNDLCISTHIHTHSLTHV